MEGKSPCVDWGLLGGKGEGLLGPVGRRSEVCRDMGLDVRGGESLYFVGDSGSDVVLPSREVLFERNG